MLGIKINGEFLDIAPGLQLELESQNPLLEFNDEISGEFSLPFEVASSSKNLRLLNYAGLLQKKVGLIGIPSELYDNGLQVSVGKIKIEKPTHNLNSTGEGKISCYYLTGSSSFFQDIKDKKLRDIDVGGDRSFDWDDFDVNGAGFWGHIHAVLNAGTGYETSNYDYAFFPVINKGWPSAIFEFDEVMNYVALGGSGGPEFLPGGFLNIPANRIIPFPYLKYIMIKAAEFVGWKIDGDIFNDVDFCKVTMINFRAINWAGYRVVLPDPYRNDPIDPVIFNLKDHLPDIMISRFFIQLRKRFAWWYEFDKVNKIIRIKKLANVVNVGVKNFTKYSNPIIIKKVNQEKKIYALKNVFIGDIADGAPDFKTVSLQGFVNEFADLPAPDETMYAFVYLVISENNFYICIQNVTTAAWEWVFYTYNIYDYLPADSTDEITTEATTVGVEYYNPYLDLIPRIDLQGQWFGRDENEAEWSIHLAFYHGLKDNKAFDPYPYASSHVYDSNFNLVANWALTFECKKSDGTDVGLYALSWKPILDLLQSPEEFEANLNLPLYEYLKLNFGDQIVIGGVKMLIKVLKPKIPYSKTIAIETVRII